MNYICDICSGYTTHPMCIRIFEEKVRTAEDKVEINCCKKCGEALFKRVKKRVQRDDNKENCKPFKSK